MNQADFIGTDMSGGIYMLPFAGYKMRAVACVFSMHRSAFVSVPAWAAQGVYGR